MSCHRRVSYVLSLQKGPALCEALLGCVKSIVVRRPSGLPPGGWGDPKPVPRVLPGDLFEDRRLQVQGTQGAPGRLLAGHRREVRADEQPVGAQQVYEVS